LQLDIPQDNKISIYILLSLHMQVYIYHVRVHIYHVYFRACNARKNNNVGEKEKDKKKKKKHLYLIL